MVDKLTIAEQKRLQMIEEIQRLHKSGESIHSISRITGKNLGTVRKYVYGNPEAKCRSGKHSPLDAKTDFIIKNIKNGLTASAIAKQLQSDGQALTLSDIRQYVRATADRYGLELFKYKRAVPHVAEDDGNPEQIYITRKGIFNHLWMIVKLSADHREKLWAEYPTLSELEKCILEFRELFEKKNMAYLYIFIDRYKNSAIKELASFARGLESDMAAVENAVASPLSNGFVEGTNSKVKTIKKAMYGKCGIQLLKAKLMYCPKAEY